MKPIDACEICRNKEITFLFGQKDKNLGIDKDFYLFRCENCKSIFLNPRPSPPDLIEHYSNEKYYSLKKIDTDSKKLKMKMLLYKTYFDEKNKKNLLKIMLSPLKFTSRGTKISPNSRLLDIGSGSGQFLYEMKTLGLDVYGVEPGNFDKEGNKKYNLKIINSDFIKVRYPREAFDIITMNHVLEHLNNPHETLFKIKNILKKKGLHFRGSKYKFFSL